MRWRARTIAPSPAAHRDRGASGPTPPERDRALARFQAIHLSWVAGAVDALGFVLLHVFTAHVTGNTVHLGIALGRARLRTAAESGFAIAAFVSGAAVGVVVRDRCRAAGLPARAVLLAVSGLFVAAFYGLALLLAAPGARPLWRVLTLTAPAALAMGCQNAAMPRAAGRRIRTYITGAMTEVAESLVDAVRSTRHRRASLGRAAALAAIWVAYAAGGVATAAAAARWGANAALLPIAALAIATAVELRRGEPPRAPDARPRGA